MLTISQKINYLFDSISRFNEPIVCPSCKEVNAKMIDRKYFFLRLFECSNCHLYFRHPIEKVESNKEFYQSEYTEGDSLTTYMPQDDELIGLKEKDFKTETDRSASRLVEIFENLIGSEVKGIKILDYGSSWGYISYQLKELFGMDVESYEISEPRANYGNHQLNLSIKTSEKLLRKENNIFFSSHVIEHVPSASSMLNLGKNLLNKDGFIVTICPNGSTEFRKQHPDNFHRGWGKVHPNYLNSDFCRFFFKNNPYYIDSYPFDMDKLKKWDKKSQVINKLNGWELLFIAFPNETL